MGAPDKSDVVGGRKRLLAPASSAKDEVTKSSRGVRTGGGKLATKEEKPKKGRRTDSRHGRVISV